jgi:hypothetical protein
MDVFSRTHSLTSGLLLALSVLPPGRALASTQVPLANPGMESPYVAVNSGAATITGQIANGWSDNSFWQAPAPTIAYSQDTVNPHGGAASQKIVVSSVGGDRFQMIQQFAQQAGNVYTLSAWVRGTPGAQVTLSIQQASSPYATYIQSSLALTNDWQQITTTGYITTTENVYLMLGMNAAGTVWVDDFAVSYTPGAPGPRPNLGPIAPTFFGMHVANYEHGTLRNAGLEPPYTQVGVANGISGQIAIHWVDNSAWANPTVVYSQDSVNPHGGTAAQKVSVRSPGTGAVQFAQPVTVIPERSYTFTAWLRGDPGMRITMILRQAAAPYTAYAQTSAVLTANWQRFTISGVVHDTGDVYLMFYAAYTGTFWVDDVTFTDDAGNPVSGGVPWPQAPFGQLRLWDSETAWTALEPVKGVWDWETLDMWVAAAEAHGVKEILLTLGQSPGWASSQPDNVNYIGAGAPAPPRDIQDWRDYITAVGQRYKGRIRNYEIWNEPNDPTYYAGTVPQLLQLTQEAYTILKSIDPANTVVAPVPYATGYLDQLLQGGMASYIDVIPFHVYTYTAPPETVGPTLANVRLVMAKNGVADMPLWDTEGASGDTTTSEDQGAAYIVRRYLVDLAYGAVRYDWYTWSKGYTFCAATEKNDPRQLTKAGVAFGILGRWLSGASLTGVTIDAAGTWQMGLTLAGGTPGLIVWNPSSSVEFSIPSSLHAATALDIFNGSTAIQGSTITVSAYPLLLSGFNGTSPATPAGLTAAAGNGRVTLTWSASTGATSYNVYRGYAADGEDTAPIASGISSTSFIDTGLANGTPYYYKVAAVNVGGTSPLSNEATATPQAGAISAPLRFVPVTPCRIADTRNAAGPFGGPTITAGSTRSFAVPQSACGIPPTAQAYSLNVTVVPEGPLSYLTLWPSGQSRPLVSTLNSWGGIVVANAAIVPAGTGCAVSVYVTNPADVILDINGYFDTSTGASSYAFYPAAPCRVADTRWSTGMFGGPAMYAGQSRDFPIPLSSCAIPATSRAYSLNVTVVPDPTVSYLGYLTTWPTGQPRPNVSTLNSWTGKVVANAAIVPAGSNESISVFVSNPTDAILDINGYFSQPGSPGALSFYSVTPCRVADTRNATGPFGGPILDAQTTRSFPIPASPCHIPATAAAYSLNVTVVPDGALQYLTAWPTGSAQPFVSTLNSWDGTVVANAAIVPAGADGAINIFVTNRTHVILDINGFFAP